MPKGVEHGESDRSLLIGSRFLPRSPVTGVEPAGSSIIQCFSFSAPRSLMICPCDVSWSKYTDNSVAEMPLRSTVSSSARRGAGHQPVPSQCWNQLHGGLTQSQAPETPWRILRFRRESLRAIPHYREISTPPESMFRHASFRRFSCRAS